MTGALSHIRAIDYTVIFTRDLDGMRAFYADIMGFRFTRALTPRWLELTVGAQTLALFDPGDDADLAARPALQLAFRVPPDAVAECATELEAKGVSLDRPVTDQPFGHRTIFFSDPDGNRLEIYAEIDPA
ncbi:VOC family protein [Pseudooceanicola sp. MF1-13]|uniref:VOC family protein n=1 Tax=Pseudooceanicola sp. MF1-13 TaxID=3379095 RepID=UPI003892A0D0